MPALPAWFREFCSEGDRFDALCRALKAAFVAFDVVETGPFRHIQVRGRLAERPAAGEKLVLAHYDRVLGTPGANDNGASVLALVDYLSQPRAGKLRVIFTDGEELSGQGGADQGSFALARSWGRVDRLLPLVLDMTGLGDTPVLGHLAEHLVRQAQGEPRETTARSRVQRAGRRLLSMLGGVEIDTPFSDDLGLLIAGVPALQLSVLPRREAAEYKRTGVMPPSWRAMHTADDRPETLWPESRTLMARLLQQFENFPWPQGR